MSSLFVGCTSSVFTPTASPNPWADDYSSLSSMENYRSWGTYNVHDPSCRKIGDYYYMYSTDAIFRENRKEAKEKGANVYAEASPHHFTLTEEAVLKYGTLARMNPPLRTEEDRQRIFGSFEQVEHSGAGQQGTGLGLAISNRLVHMMGGTIELESQIGEGSTFRFSITLKPVRAHHVKEEVSRVERDFTGVRVLVTEDNPLNREILQYILEDMGMSVENACDGKEAVDTFTASEKGYYDLIIMDIMMPVMNGLEAAHAIRTTDHPDHKKIPIIAISANAFDEDIRRSLASGMNAHLSKPIEVDKLRETLGKLLK